MIAKSALTATLDLFSDTQPGLVWFWLVLCVFSLLLSRFRMGTRVYWPAAVYYALASLAQGIPLLATIFGFAAFPIVLFAAAGARLALIVASERACDTQLHRGWRIVSLVTVVLTVLAAIAAFALGSDSFVIAGVVVTILFALHSLSAAVFFGLAASSLPAARRLLAGAVPWALLWCAAAALGIATMLGFEATALVYGYLPLAVHAADGLMGLAVLTAVMLELAKPAPEDTALDDYTAKITESIERFIPNELMFHLEKADFFDLRLGDHIRKDMTIFFSDIRAFTELSEQLTPEESFAFVNSYLSRVVPIIRTHGGFIDKYMGDGIMALFADANGADQAVESAV
ncbi:MAG: adenylate/guanylate cyclase domain-containing protein, partial [Spirochaetales bacterium]|nr:adenylate/guanylate cyclase domain-containing protein [Spirochaetales bacterium]